MSDERRNPEHLGTARSSHDQVICHVDMDCFYAACERLREPALRGEPLVVGMGYESDESHGAVATASYEAREYGVESAMGITEALDNLPRKVDAASDPDLDVEEAGFYRPVDLDYYQEVASEVKTILHESADVVREVSIDEAYLDVTDRVRWGATDASLSVGTDPPGEDAITLDEGPTVSTFARELTQRIQTEVGVVASVGVAPTMSAAKIASDYDKPDGLVVVEPGEVREFLAPLAVDEIHNVGPVTARKLREMGVETAGDLAEADPDSLRDRFGQRGLEVRRFARGEDPREVEPVGDPKSLSRESAFIDPTDDSERKRERVRGLAADVAERAEREGALYQTIGIKVVQPPFDVNTRAESLPGPIQDEDLVTSTALDLLDEFSGQSVRKLGVRVSNLSFAGGEQASLTGFGDDSPADDDGQAGDDDPAGDADRTTAGSGSTVGNASAVDSASAAANGAPDSETSDGNARIDSFETETTRDDGEIGSDDETAEPVIDGQTTLWDYLRQS